MCLCLSPGHAQVKELGRGCFGSVWLAKWRGVEVALKEVLNPSATDTAAMDVFAEAEKLASLQHPCVMAFYGVVISPGNCATIAEYICHGSLRSGLTKVKRKVSMGQRGMGAVAWAASSSGCSAEDVGTFKTL
jgi:serine/threonine protein kinase